MKTFEAVLDEITIMNDKEMFLWLVNKRLLRDTMKCLDCNQSQTLKECKDGWLGLEWRCMSLSCSRYQFSSSVRVDSVFESISIKASRFLKVLCYWSQGLNQSEILKFVTLSRPTMSKLRKLFIERIERYYIRNPIRLGGPGVIINCDELMLNYKVKSHRGRGPREKIWALAIVDTSTAPSTGFLKIVENRQKSTLLPIINSVVRAGSVIHTDEWASYQALGDNEFSTHRTVVHKYNFVCPITGVHTQNVESFNNKIMLKVKEMKGLNVVGRDLFTTAFCFLDKFKDESFEKLIELLVYDY